MAPWTFFLSRFVLLAVFSCWFVTAQADESSDLTKLISNVRPSIATIRVEGRDGDELGVGTGFVIDPDGLIVTNYHVINEGRKFTVEIANKDFKVLAVEASDREADLVIIRVALGIDEEDGHEHKKLPALAISDGPPDQGTRVVALGNPLGLKNSAVEGIVSAIREVEGRQMIQLAMPVEPGNSGGPVVNQEGEVLGIVNMKSVIDQNLGFAIPIDRLTPLRKKPNPISIDRWVRLGTINPDRWKPLLGATWQERGGIISARGKGKGFGGRSLCLSTEASPERPFEITTMVRLDDESGAAGLAFFSDGNHKHYGFYPSNGRMRLTCFKGASVYSWQVLDEVESEHYLPAQWNRLRVRVGKEKLECFVNGQLVITSTDGQLSEGRHGLVKFRTTQPDFKRFQIGDDLQQPQLDNAAKDWLAKLASGEIEVEDVDAGHISYLRDSGDATSQELLRCAAAMEDKAVAMRRLASDVRLAATIGELESLFSPEREALQDDDRLLTATLLIAQLDNPDIDIEFYRRRIDEMGAEVQSSLPAGASDVATREALDKYLFNENGFHGGRSEYYHPANSHLNRVIDDREGLPITLSILYIELGRRLHQRIEGIGLPGHFVVKHVPAEEDEQLIDVFDGGKLMSSADARRSVAEFARREITDHDLRSQTDQEIVTRILSNLMSIATRNEDMESMLRYIEAMVAINSDSIEYRTMRMQLRGMTDRKSRAIEDIDWLLQQDEQNVDHDRLKQLRAALTK